MRLVISIFVLILIFIRTFQIDDSIVAKWYQSLNDKSVCSVPSFKVKFNIDFNFGEMRKKQNYSTKFKRAYTHRPRNNNKELEKVHERNFENFRNFQRIFEFE